jgi:curved DNA-binding protein CbpA
MENPYDTLGVLLEDNEATIRARYLALVTQFPPEHHPERFAAIRRAYEAIGTLEARCNYHIFHEFEDTTIDGILEELECQTNRQTFSLAGMPLQATYLPLETPS